MKFQYSIQDRSQTLQTKGNSFATAKLNPFKLFALKKKTTLKSIEDLGNTAQKVVQEIK